MLISARRRRSTAALGLVVLAEGRIGSEATFTRAQLSSFSVADGFVAPLVVVSASVIASSATFTRAQSDALATGDV